MSSLIVSANIIGIRSKEKRSHREVLLPIRRRTLAITRSSLIILPAVVFMILGIALQLFYSGYIQTWYDSIYELMMMSGTIMVFGNMYFYISDLYSEIISKGSPVIFNSVVLSLLLIAMVIIAVSIRNTFNASFTVGLAVIVLFLLAGFTMSAATISSYNKREFLTD